MNTVFLSTGTNLGDKQQNLKEVNTWIAEQIGNIVMESSVYCSAAWGGVEQDNFYNQVLCVETTLDAIVVLQKCLDIEKEMGRIRTVYWGPRIVDIDILFFNDTIINDSEILIVPHPRLYLRNFVLAPFCEIAPDWVHPQLNKTMLQLWDECPDVLMAKIINHENS